MRLEASTWNRFVEGFLFLFLLVCLVLAAAFWMDRAFWVKMCDCAWEGDVMVCRTPPKMRTCAYTFTVDIGEEDRIVTHKLQGH